jgi:HEAT repeat protein
VRTRLLLLGAQTVALGLMTAFLVVPVSALFLDEYGADALPYVYLAVAVAGVGSSWLMSRVERRWSLGRLAARVVATYLLAVAAGWLVLVGWDALWVTFPLLVLFPLSIPVGFVLVGSQAGRLLDVRQMKAHFPRVAAGFSIGFAIGGLGAAALVSPMGGPRPLLALDVLAAILMLGLVVVTRRSFPSELGIVPDRAAAPDETEAPDRWGGLLRNPMVALILAYQVLSAAVTQLLDFMVWERAAARFPDPSSLAQFQGLFGAGINVVSVLFVMLFGGWLLTRYGVGFGLAANPLGVLVLLMVTVATGYAAGPGALVFFALVCAQQVTDISLTDGTTRTSVNATYQALPHDDRVRAQTMIEGAGVPLALGFVGLLLIAHDALGLDIRAVVVVTLLLTIGWVLTAVLAFREYGVNLRAAVSRRTWDPRTLSMEDAASDSAVRDLLGSTDAHDVRAALDALVDSGAEVTPHLLALLTHADPARRTLGLEVAVLTDRLATEAVALVATGLLHDDNEEVALRAAAALVRMRDGTGSDARSAWLAALTSDDPSTAASALVVATETPHRFFVPYLVGLASAGTASAEVLDALGAHCDHLAPRVRGLLDDATVPRQTRERIVHALGRAGTPDARDLLVDHLDDGDPTIVEATARCLVAAGHRDTPGRLELESRLATMAGRVDRCLAILLLLGDQAPHQPLSLALRDEVATGAGRVEVLLELVHEPRAIRAAVSGLASSDERGRSTALETLEVTVGRPTARTALALLDATVGDTTRRRLLADQVRTPVRTLGEWLCDLVADPVGSWGDPWLRACAIYAVPAELSDGEALALAVPLRDDVDSDVAETAQWLCSRVAGAGFRQPFAGPSRQLSVPPPLAPLD